MNSLPGKQLRNGFTAIMVIAFLEGLAVQIIIDIFSDFAIAPVLYGLAFIAIAALVISICIGHLRPFMTKQQFAIYMAIAIVAYICAGSVGIAVMRGYRGPNLFHW
jgi:hypothetical protein